MTRGEKAAYQKAWRIANAEKVKGYALSRYQAKKVDILAAGKAWREANPEKNIASIKAWREANPEKRRASKRGTKKRWREANREEHRSRVKARRLRQLEGKAGRPRPGACEICEDAPEKGLVWDHCHNSGKFRGWICSACNTALGMVRDSEWRLLAMVVYLRDNDTIQADDTIRVAA